MMIVLIGCVNGTVGGPIRHIWLFPQVSLDRRKLLEECSGGEKRAAVDKLVREMAEAVERRESSEESKGDKGRKKKKSIVETIMEKVRFVNRG